ncbi:MAG TPA: hypothetical protein VF254_10515 [Gammaproteobacteria bacterium]
MIDPEIVRLALEYLDYCEAEGCRATLVGMHWYIDARHRTLPLIEEVNEALRRRENVFVRRETGLVVFASSGTERAVNGEDMKASDARYRKEFAAALKKKTE